MEDDLKKINSTKTIKSKNNNIFEMEDASIFFKCRQPQKINATKTIKSKTMVVAPLRVTL
jgi:hypothetical protein